jgi:hypothetical protein
MHSYFTLSENYRASHEGFMGCFVGGSFRQEKGPPKGASSHWGGSALRWYEAQSAQ